MKGQASSLGKTPSQRRLAGPAQPDERDAPRAVGGDMPGGVTFDQLGQRGQLRGRHAGKHVEHMRHGRGTAIGARQEIDDRHVERLRNRLEDDHRRIALPAFDLREIALGRAGLLRQLTPRHAALGAGQPHQPADGGDERVMLGAPGLRPARLAAF